MKKAIALLAVLAMVFATITPVFAEQDASKQLEDLIGRVKSVIDIPASYETFTSNMRTDENGITRWNLEWAENTNPEYYWERKSISVEICSDGFIDSYSKYESDYKYSEIVKIPAVSKEEAGNKVKEFISKVTPQLEGQIQWTDPSVSDGNYYFNFYRIVDGINVKFNNVNFTVSGVNGEIRSYYANWNNSLKFPASKGAITVEKAQQIYKENMPLSLEYKINSDGNIYLQYAPSRDSGNMFINALTGKTEEIANDYGIYDRAAGAEAMYSSKAKAALTPAEQKEVDQVDGLISAEEAEKKVRAISEFNFDSSYKLTGSYLNQSKSTYGKTVNYYYNLSFTQSDEANEKSEKDAKIVPPKEGKYAYASVNAKTGEVNSFSSSNWVYYKQTEKQKVSFENGSKAADDFIKKYHSDKSQYLKYYDNKNKGDNLIYEYYRFVNGAYFDYDMISLTVDSETGKISNYNINWTENITIPPTDGIISLDKATEVMFGEVGLKLEYIYNNMEAVLAYKLNDEKSQLIDAKTGKLIDWSGEEFKQNNPPQYNDIAGHFAENAIKQLVNIGVFIEGESFSPDSFILQKDYVTFLSKLGKFYFDKNDVNSIYSYLIKNGVMEQSEKNPDGYVTREDAVKFLLRYLDYKRFAEIPGIFKCEFVDANEINPSLIGYAAIAKGLGIVSGSDGYFKPKDTLTKGETAVIIYNCLNNKI